MQKITASCFYAFIYDCVIFSITILWGLPQYVFIQTLYYHSIYSYVQYIIMAIFIEGEDNVQPRPQQAESSGVGGASADGRGWRAVGHWRETLSKPSDTTWRAQNKHETVWDVTHAHKHTSHSLRPAIRTIKTSGGFIWDALMAEHGLCGNHALSDCEKLKAYQLLNKLLQQD